MPVCNSGSNTTLQELIISSECFNTEMITKPSNSPAGQFHLTKDNIPMILNRELPEAWEIAASVAYLLGDKSAHVTKASWFVDGGWVEGNYSSG
jgi:NAD(P)-dependent dehydrogenase (short-subunit alcohol dehydrogenase family)